MGRKLKPLKPELSPKPVRNVAKIEARRSFVWQYMLQGADSRAIQQGLSQLKPPIEVSTDTIEDDMKALYASLETVHQGEREKAAALAIAKLNRLQLKLERVGQLAETGGGAHEIEEEQESGPPKKKIVFTIKPSLHAAATAYAAARQVVMDTAKVAGAIIERQEVTGEILNKNMEVPASKKDTDELKDALNRAGVIVTTTKDAAE